MTMCSCENPKMFYWSWDGIMCAACSNCKAALKPPPILTRYGKKLKELECNLEDKSSEVRYDLQSELSKENDVSESSPH